MPTDPSPTDLHLRALALAHRRDITGAAALCHAALAVDPEHVGALRLIARLLHARGRPEAALVPLKHAMRLSPTDARLHREAGLALGQLGRHPDAMAAFALATRLDAGNARAWTDLAAAALAAGDPGAALAASDRALRLRPGVPAAHASRAAALRRLGRMDDAVLASMAAVTADPASARLRLSLGHLLRQAGRMDEALASYRAAQSLRPDDSEGHRWAGCALHALGHHDHAIAALRRSVALRPDQADAWHELGVALASAGRHGDAADAFGRVIALAPGHAAALANLGSALQELDRWPEAEQAFRRSLAIAPDTPDVLYNLGNTLLMADRHAEAVAAYDRSLHLQPEEVGRRYNRGHALLGCGRLAEGWADLDAYWAMSRPTAPPPLPFWDGQETPGRVLLWGEHGVGDEVLACGLLPEAAARAGAVTVATDRRLVPVLQRAFPALTVIARGDKADGPIVAHRPLSSLPGLLRPTMESFRHHAGYLVPDAARTAALRSRYRSRGGRLVVGISWRSTNRLFGQRKSVPLADWEPILDLPGITFVALQHGDIADEAAAAGLLHDREIDPLVDLDGFAAQTAAMDLVVSVSNSTVHFAGALARPCWLMLPSGNGLLWHWQLCRGDRSPWYPALRVFRQDRPGGWDGMLAQIARALAAHASAEPTPAHDRSTLVQKGDLP
ncbi:Flp pilus assembly protein TadD [Stella humosa]|uniref:Flp pilus assembly protein TadD n=1 Tax=Stella humosa TaxID=94 RepID=A0A3N1MF27_9PROT|nr:tetratricopeptide repeat protein [Stella humosa]ROQ01307.1 Flp pilus assembly protein TadD [Stella humosa]BBK31681.1 hypothetical protein STHU_23150 [Stella humosa]